MYSLQFELFLIRRAYAEIVSFNQNEVTFNLKGVNIQPDQPNHELLRIHDHSLPAF